MPRTFLVATDLSPRADRAVQRAFRLAGWCGADLVLVSVIDADLPAEIAGQMTAAAELRLAQFAASIPHSGEVRHDTRVLSGDPCEAIPALAAELDAGLVILGLHRPRAFLDILRETTMERIVRHSPRPVLLVRDPVDHAYASVLAAIDFGPASTAALMLAAEIAPEADIHGVHALHIPYRGFVTPQVRAGAAEPFRLDAEAALSAWRDIHPLPARLTDIEIAEGPAHRVLADRIETLSPDLLALGAHGRAGAAPSLLGSLANDLMRAPPCDLLIAR
ncbi:universal stress protein [Rhodovulum euryhalinum]|uniref:Nucleotide-binding universal stress UspA family protein n=1 Tax=Rhodovulum euryhalinum TaxID=35805 RepID=A0A4R2KA88_9RHOB|nr:universal stress protein [Rhodovulum euryhalinum]TCO70353.1 nucleotide-binding universal stress UspA family protein [Rhodovulum euryhalinum]